MGVSTQSTWGEILAAMAISWRVALLFVSAVALCAADAEMEYPQVVELAEMGEGDGAYMRESVHVSKSKQEDAMDTAKRKIEKIAEEKAKAAAKKAEQKVENKLETKVVEAKEEAKVEKKAAEDVKANAERKEEEAKDSGASAQKAQDAKTVDAAKAKQQEAEMEKQNAEAKAKQVKEESEKGSRQLSIGLQEAAGEVQRLEAEVPKAGRKEGRVQSTLCAARELEEQQG